MPSFKRVRRGNEVLETVKRRSNESRRGEREERESVRPLWSLERQRRRVNVTKQKICNEREKRNQR